MFHDAFGRQIDASALEFFAGLMSQGATAAQVAGIIFSSDEYRRVRVNATFEQFMGRDADSGALDFYAAQLDHGAQDGAIITQLISSDEYYKHAQI